LIFGGGDAVDVGLGVARSEPLTNLQDILTEAGFGVDVSSTLPTNLMQYRAIWFIDTNPLTANEETQLEAFVNSGRGLYLTGERPCCENLDSADTTVINALVQGGGVQAGGQGDADNGSAPNTVNSSAIDGVASVPNVLTTWTPNQPGGMTGVASDNVLTSTNFGGNLTATGAVWDGSSLVDGAGRLAILMDINWLESEFWDATTAPLVAVNLEHFLMSNVPVPIGAKPGWAGYAAKVHGARDVSGAWTVPTVDCSKATEASALGIWVGIDGFGNNKLVKAGVAITCQSTTATPCYYLFTQVLPGTENPIGSACSGVSPGDQITADVTNSPFGSSTFLATLTDNGSQVGSPITLTAPTKRDRSAECVAELPAGGQLPSGSVGATPGDIELAGFGSISFTQCQATATQNAGDTLDTDQLAMGSDGAFSVVSLNMGNPGRPLATVAPPSFPGLQWSVNWLSSH